MTRRALLGRLSAGLALVLLAGRAAAPAAAEDLGGGALAYPLRLRAGRGLLAGGGRRYAGRVILNRPACLVGLRWDAAVAPAELRGRRPGGAWTPWVAVAPSEHAPEDGSGARTSDPVWVGAVNAVEVRSPQPIKGLVACVVSRGEPSRRLLHALDLPTAPNGVRPPDVQPRSAWTGGKLKPREPAELGEVLAAIVHHTTGTDDYGPEDSPAIVQAICRFHRNISKWSDIGYHLLVDRYGQVFEGRAGGLDQPLVGAHAFGANRQTVGIAVLGTWSASELDDDGMAALARALAWKLSLHGCPVEGTVTLTDGATGEKRELERIAGHRDWNSTRCPGRTLRAALPDLRERAANLVVPPPVLTFEASSAQLPVGKPISFSGRLTKSDGTPIPWRRLAIVRAEPRPAAGVGFATTDANGWYRLDTTLRDGGGYEARLADGSFRSRRVHVLVEPRLRIAVRRRNTPEAPGLHVRAWVKPHLRSAVLEVDRRNPQGGWERVLRWHVRLRRGTFDLQVPLRQAGRHRVRVRGVGEGRIAPVEIAHAQAIVRVPWSGPG